MAEHKRAPVQLKFRDVDGFYMNRRQKYVHLVLVAEHAQTLCGRPVTTKIGLGEMERLDWKTVCPTCLDAVPGFLDWWRREHKPIPY